MNNTKTDHSLLDAIMSLHFENNDYQLGKIQSLSYIDLLIHYQSFGHCKLISDFTHYLDRFVFRTQCRLASIYKLISSHSLHLIIEVIKKNRNKLKNWMVLQSSSYHISLICF